MIGLRQKPLKDILAMIEPYKRILVVGCETCAAMSQAGGLRQAETLKRALEIKFKLTGRDATVDATSVVRQCDVGMVRDGLAEVVADHDVILSMACGAGVQTVAEVFPDIPVLPACDTVMIGSHNRELSLIHI